MLVFLFVFVGLQLLVAFWAQRRIRTEDDFLVAGRSLGPVLAAVSIFATWFGAESCIGAAGSAYVGGWSLLEPEPFAYGVCLIVTGAFFAARLWRLRITTLADFLSRRFGASSERLAAVLLLPSSLLWAAAQIRAFGHVVAINSNGALDVDTAVMLAAGIAIVYTVTGGLLADVYTDALQCAALLAGLVALGVAVWINLPADTADAAATATVEAATPPSPTAPGILQVLENWAIPICGSVVAQEVISRALAARSPGVARGATIAGGGFYLLVGAIPLAIGVVGPQLAPGLDNPEGILPHLSQQLLPAALNFLFAGALIAAILSTVDSCLLVASSLVARNLTPRLGSERSRLRMARVAVVVGGLVAFALARSDWNVADLVEEASGFGSAGVFVLACVGLFGTAGHAIAANLALATGLGVWIVARHVLADVPTPYLWSLGGTASAFAIGTLLERLKRPLSSGTRPAA